MRRSEVAERWEASADTWTRHVRAGYDIYRDALNTPAFLAMLPPIGGLAGLDIGCGEGANTVALARLGALMHAVDIAPTFIQHAQAAEQAEPLGIRYQVGDGMALPFEDGCFDFATAFMCLMDMPDQGLALREAHRVLRPGGFLQFSIQHPCFFPEHRRVLRDEHGSTRAIEVAGYFATGPIEQSWRFSTLPQEERNITAPFRAPRFHRTLGSWVGIICSAGFVIEQVVEPCAGEALAAAEPAVADTRVAPMSLLARVRKPNG